MKKLRAVVVRSFAFEPRREAQGVGVERGLIALPI